ncbi:MAG: hypothetical protein D6718_03845, partial [Acidobacteria bacterium]
LLLALAGVLLAVFVPMALRGGGGTAQLAREAPLWLGLVLAARWAAKGGRLLRGLAGSLFPPAILALALAAPLSGLRPHAAPPPGAAQVAAGHSGPIVVIGVDGLGWEMLERWRNSGGSADFDWLASRAAWGPLATVEPTRSPVIWTTIATGRTPEDHGVLEFTSWRVSHLGRSLATIPRGLGAVYWMNLAQALGLVRLGPVTSQDVRCPRFWEIAGTAERPAAVAGWWCTWPASPVEGRLVSDKFYFWRDARRAGLSDGGSLPPGVAYPPELAGKLAELRVPPEAMSAEEVLRLIDIPEEEAATLAGRPYRHHDVLSELPLAYTMDRTWENVARELLATGSPRGIYAFYLRGVDLLSHSALAFSDLYPEIDSPADLRRRYGGLISRYLSLTFARVRRLIEAAGPDAAVLVVSDHGFEVIEHKRHGDPWPEFGHDHAPPGVFFALGPGVAPGPRRPTISVYDIAPTVLGLAGYPAAEDMPGRPLTEIFGELDRSELRSRIASYGQRSRAGAAGFDRAREAEGRELELLRSLGYID